MAIPFLQGDVVDYLRVHQPKWSIQFAKLRQLPDRTRVWCAHEYTLSNLKFAVSVDGDNQDLQARYQLVQRARSQGVATIPSLLADEKQTNPFLRWDSSALQAIAKIQEPARVFARIRGMKDRF